MSNQQQREPRPTFGKGISQIIDIFYGEQEEYTGLSKSLYNDQSIIDYWQEFKQAHPDLANRIVELRLLDRMEATRIDNFLANIGYYHQHVFKTFAYNIIKKLDILDNNDYYSIGQIESNPKRYSNIELLYFLRSKISLFCNGSEYDKYIKNLEVILPLFDDSSWEYYRALIDNLFERNLTYNKNQGQVTEITKKSLKFLWINRKKIARYGGDLLEEFTQVVQNHVKRSVIEPLIKLSEQERLSYVIGLLDSSAPKDPTLCIFNKIEYLCEHYLDSYFLKLIDMIIPKKITDWSLYGQLVELLLASEIFHIERIDEEQEILDAYEEAYYAKKRFRSNLVFTIHFLHGILATLYKNNQATVELETRVHDKLYSLYIIYTNYKKSKENFSPLIRTIIKLFIALHVDVDDKDTKISHYTTAENAEKMLLATSESRLRLFSTYKLNDPEEGKLLAKYLSRKEKKESKNFDKEESMSFAEKLNLMSHHSIGFVACFTFERNNFNQFRLYGKSSFNGVEAAGVAIEMNNQFFTNNIIVTSQYQDMSSGYPLYRCVYVNKYNPEKITLIAGYERNKIEELQHEIYLLRAEGASSEQINEHEEKIADLQRKIEQRGNAVAIALKELRDHYDENQELNDIEHFFMEQLKHLIKNDEYKAENECRIFDIISPRSNQIEGKSQAGNLYIEDQRDFRLYINKIILGENFSYPELFIYKLKSVKLKQNKINITKIKYKNEHITDYDWGW